MSKIEISKVTVEDYPIPQIRAEWWEGETWHVVELPLAWLLKQYGGPVTDKTVNSRAMQGTVIFAIRRNPDEFVHKIREDDEWSARIASLKCSDNVLPECFLV